MWADLLPKLIGGTMIDRDAPDDPTTIVGFRLTDTDVYVVGEDFEMGGDRRFWGITTDGDDADDSGRFILRGYLISGVLIAPKGFKS